MMDWLDTHLVPEWRKAYKWWGTHGITALGAFTATVAGYPDLLVTLAAMMGGTPRLQAAVIAVVILIIVARLWRQGDDAAE